MTQSYPASIFTPLLLAVVILAISGCADLSYYLHSIDGHYAIVDKTRDIDEVLEDTTDKRLAKRLQLVKRIREFAFDQLLLPQSDSYSVYADLERSYVLRNLFAAAEFSTRPHQWCYPIIGCASYRGYFDEQRLARYVAKLKQQNFDVYVANVPAYSTLGWFDDPVLNTFIHWPEYRLAGLIFHELSHQLLFIDGDSMFNESFAVAVQQIGIERWLMHTQQTDQLNRYRVNIRNRTQVIQLIGRVREELANLYQRNISAEQKRTEKQRTIDSLKTRYAELSSGFDVPDGFQRWFQGDINNAKLASVSTYHAQVPAFRRLFVYNEEDFASFYQHVESIARLPMESRQKCLQAWSQASFGPDASARPVNTDIPRCADESVAQQTAKTGTLTDPLSSNEL